MISFGKFLESILSLIVLALLTYGIGAIVIFLFKLIF